MTEDELKAINIQIETYCNADLKDEHLPAYRSFFVFKNYQHCREAIELAYNGGYLDNYVQKRIIPSPHIFQEFLANIQHRESQQMVEKEEEVTIERRKFNLGMYAIVTGLLRIRFSVDSPSNIQWGRLRAENGQRWIDIIADFWRENGEGVISRELFLQTIEGIAPGLAQELKQQQQQQQPEQEPAEVPF